MPSKIEILSLTQYWRIAATPLPIVVVGGGRWGKTWASVIAGARGTSAGLAIAARTDAESVRHWLSEQIDLNEVALVTSLEAAVQINPPPVAAIIASRPKDHVCDGLAALERGLHVLVEKPISPQVGAAKSLLAAARSAGKVLAIGTEFAFLPALHAAADALPSRDKRGIRLVLEWNDLNREQRYGWVKTHHEETNVLVDLLAHAVSVFRIFSLGSALHLVRANLSTDGHRGGFVLYDENGGEYELRCDRVASDRRRLLEITQGRTHATVNFADNPTEIVLDGQNYELSSDLLALSSTLRLELGAFMMEVMGVAPTTPISESLEELLRLQIELECFLH